MLVPIAVLRRAHHKIGAFALAIQFSPVISSRRSASGSTFSVQAVDLSALGEWSSPVLVLDHFRVTGRPFPPHPHAGFSAVTYVFEDSQCGVRSRDSLGNDVVTGPGGIVWTEAGSGLLHEETPAEPGAELHAVQIFVNLSAKNKLVAPRMLKLGSSAVPEWRSIAGDRVRVLAGAYDQIESPLIPAEPFDLFDIRLQGEVLFQLPEEHNAIIYVLSGRICVRTEGHEEELGAEQAVALVRSGPMSFHAISPAHALLLRAADLREPVRSYGPFIMSEQWQIEAAATRYRSGGMGHLEPISKVEDASSHTS